MTSHKQKKGEMENKVYGDMLVTSVGETLLKTYSWLVKVHEQRVLERDVVRDYMNGILELNEKLRVELVKKHNIDL